jgi:hypothetical protein
MTDETNMFGITALIAHARSTRVNSRFTKEYLAHVRRVMAATQREIDAAMIQNPELRDIRF